MQAREPSKMRVISSFSFCIFAPGAPGDGSHLGTVLTWGQFSPGDGSHLRTVPGCWVHFVTPICNGKTHMQCACSAVRRGRQVPSLRDTYLYGKTHMQCDCGAVRRGRQVPSLRDTYLHIALLPSRNYNIYKVWRFATRIRTKAWCAGLLYNNDSKEAI